MFYISHTSKNATKLLFILFSALSFWSAQAATINQYTTQATYDAALLSRPAHLSTLEDFSSVTTNYSMATGAGDNWDGFSVARSGVGFYGTSGYCPALNAPISSTPTSCVGYNTSAPALPGIVGSFDVGTPASITFTPDASNKAFAFSFDFVDWNDLLVRSSFTVLLIDGSSLAVSGGINPANAPAEFFGFIVDPASVTAGIYITQINWIGVTSELVGFWNVGTKYHLANPTDVPTLSEWTLIALMFILLLVGINMARSRRLN